MSQPDPSTPGTRAMSWERIRKELPEGGGDERQTDGPAVAWIQVASGPDASAIGLRIGLHARLVTTIGRDEAARICVEDPLLSRRHARIVLHGGKFVLLDRGSRNGTFVNGERVEEHRALNDGDTVELGDTVLRFEAGCGVPADAFQATTVESDPSAGQPTLPGWKADEG